MGWRFLSDRPRFLTANPIGARELRPCDAVRGAAIPGVDTPDYDRFVREITTRNNPFHQPSSLQFPREFRFHMARTSLRRSANALLVPVRTCFQFQSSTIAMSGSPDKWRRAY